MGGSADAFYNFFSWSENDFKGVLDHEMFLYMVPPWVPQAPQWSFPDCLVWLTLDTRSSYHSMHWAVGSPLTAFSYLYLVFSKAFPK